ncbi:uncharacterized protein LOC141856989 [Brevipalpus obovatus]|uniref:uncharacterized protein LOC141856989 n=1 Tax=Brevipalpus obovatus TaxID=246614 RepID=UPI003D9DD756
MSFNEEKIANAITAVLGSKFSPEEARMVAMLFTPENLRIWINMCKLSSETKVKEPISIPKAPTSDGESCASPPSSSSSSGFSGSPESDSILSVSDKLQNLMLNPPSSSSSDSKASGIISESHVHRNSLSTSSDGSSKLTSSSISTFNQPGSVLQIRPTLPYARSRPGFKPKSYNHPNCAPRGNQPFFFCKMCMNNGEPWKNYTSHNLKDKNGFTTCPVLFRYTCELCHASGKHAHTRSHCPMAVYLRGLLPPTHPLYARLVNFRQMNPSTHRAQRNHAK